MSTLESDETDSPNAPELGRRFWVAVVLGGALMVWGAYLFIDATSTFDRRVNFVVYLVGAALVHDFVVAPAICAAGLVCVRLLPDRARAPAQAGLIVTGAVLLVAILPLQGTAEGTGNETIQPLNYATATLTALAIVWVAAGVWLVIRLRRGRSADG